MVTVLTGVKENVCWMRKLEFSTEKQKLSKKNQREELKNTVSEKKWDHWMGLTKEWRWQKFSAFEAVIIKSIQYEKYT